jgi:carboxypeptidase C (cathepsin A)
MSLTKLIVCSALLALCCAKPLLLTPLLRENKTAEARSASTVTVGEIALGHSGFFTVDSPSGKKDNNIFTWFQPCSKGCDPSAPFVMWFQGGPGGPGTFGALTEIGSHYIDKDLKLQERVYSWCADYNCLFIDQPVQTGFSFQIDKKTGKFDPKDIEYTSTSPDAMAQSLQVLLQFFEIWPEYHTAPFYITGESYGGLYTSHFAKVLLDHNKKVGKSGGHKINLRGLAVGDPLIDNKVQWPTYPNTLYGMGVIMLEDRKKLENIFAKGGETKSTHPYLSLLPCFSCHHLYLSNRTCFLPGFSICSCRPRHKLQRGIRMVEQRVERRRWRRRTRPLP